MYETEIYLGNVRRNLYPRLFTMFFIGLTAAVLSSVISFLLSDYFSKNTYYTIIYDTESAGIIKQFCISRFPSLILIIIISLSVFTMFNRTVIILSGMWRGLSTGCFIALASGGHINGLSEQWSAGIVFFFIETILLLILSAYSNIYSDVISTLKSAGVSTYPSAMTAEYIRCALIISGAMFLSGTISEILLL